MHHGSIRNPCEKEVLGRRRERGILSESPGGSKNSEQSLCRVYRSRNDSASDFLLPAWTVLSKPIVTLSDVSAPVKVHGMQFLYDFLPKISGGKLNLSLEGVGGGVSDGELGDVEGSSYDGIESIRVTTSAQPKEVLYLKGFVGSEYTGDSWKPGDEDALQDAALNWKTEGNSLLYLQNLPFLRMMYTQTQQPEQMTVERLNAKYKVYLCSISGLSERLL